jgi:nitroreductase
MPPSHRVAASCSASPPRWWRIVEVAMTPEELLSTTRSVRRRLDFDRPVPAEIVLDCLQLALQAPTGSNRQGWQWLIVTDPEKKRFIGERYREAWYAYNSSGRTEYPEGDPRREQTPRVVRSAQYLADRMGDVPLMVLPCIEGRVEGQSNMAVAGLYGSILPATWSFMLAARLRGLGSAYTTLHLKYEEEIANALGIPYQQVTQAALLPVAYYTGDHFRPAERLPLDSIVHW